MASVAPPQTPADVLHSLFGFAGFRGQQEQVVTRVLAGQRTLAIMPTGAGKSLCYQLPAVIMDGTCIVISPLIALMHDQMRAELQRALQDPLAEMLLAGRNVAGWRYRRW